MLSHFSKWRKKRELAHHRGICIAYLVIKRAVVGNRESSLAAIFYIVQKIQHRRISATKKKCTDKLTSVLSVNITLALQSLSWDSQESGKLK